MRSKSFYSSLLAATLVLISARQAASQTTYTTVAMPAPAPTATSYAVASPAATSYIAPNPAETTPAISNAVPPATAAALTSFPPSAEIPSTKCYQAAFRSDPFSALREAAARQSQTGKPALTADEFDFFQDASDGQADHWSMAEAALLISGVTAAAERQQYVARIDKFADEAIAATAKGKTPQAKAKLLGRYLLKGPMHGGYVSGQFNMRELLETGKFNCVSSAVMFNMLARRIGLEVGAVAMPHHVFSRIPGFDIEPTGAGVYPADIRVKRIFEHLDHFHEKLGDAYTAECPYHETGDFGDLAEIYFDDGCDQSEAHDYAGAVVSFLKAACLDATGPHVGNGLNNAFKAWFKSAIENHQYAEAASVATFYRQILRDPSPANTMFAQLGAAQQHLTQR